MANYYDEVLEEIKDLMKKGNSTEAMAIVKRELNMPYVPLDTEAELKKLKKDLQYQISERSGGTEVSLDVLLERLKGTPEEQLSAAASLSKRSLRECTGEIQVWLKSDPLEQAGALIVEAIAEQAIGEEYTWNRKGVEYTFFGDGLIPAAESKGFLEAQKLLEDWLSNDRPDLYEMTRTLLIQEVYLFLPLSYEEGEGESLALENLEQVSQMMDDGESYQEITASLEKKKKMN